MTKRWLGKRRFLKITVFCLFAGRSFLSMFVFSFFFNVLAPFVLVSVPFPHRHHHDGRCLPAQPVTFDLCWNLKPSRVVEPRVIGNERGRWGICGKHASCPPWGASYFPNDVSKNTPRPASMPEGAAPRDKQRGGGSNMLGP